MASLPIPEVVELDFEDVISNLERLRAIGEDPNIIRSDDLNAALAALPVISQFVRNLQEFDGDTEELPKIEGVIKKVNIFNEIVLKSFINTELAG